MQKLIYIVAALFCALSLVASAAQAGPVAAAHRQPLLSAIAGHGSARVIVTLNNQEVRQLRQRSRAYSPPKDQPLSAHAGATPDGQLAEAVAEASWRVAARAAAAGGGRVDVHRPFRVVGGFVATVDQAGLNALENDPEVSAIFEDKAVPVPRTERIPDGGYTPAPSSGVAADDPVYSPMVNDSTRLIGASQAWGAGKDGTGWYVAVLDTGVLTSHEMFVGKNVVEACFSTTDATYKAVTNCPNGHASQIGTGAAEPNTELHGTHVAGIAVGNNQSWSAGEPLYGVAPGADLIAVQIFSKTTSNLLCCPNSEPGCSAPCEVTFTSDQISGLEYVYSLRNVYDIASVNMSLGAAGSSWSYSCDANNAEQTAAIDSLKAANIATVVASGNDGSCFGINTPACISSAIAVGSTNVLDVRADYSNFATGLLDIYAPGSGICSAVISSNTAYECHSGTSMATPHVAGALALIRQMDETITVDDIKTLLRDSGASVSSTCSGDTTRRVAMAPIVEEYRSAWILQGVYLLLLDN